MKIAYAYIIYEILDITIYRYNCFITMIIK